MEFNGDVSLSITSRRGETFEGIYMTEKETYALRVAGTIRGDAIAWTFTKPIRDTPSHDLVGRCHVEGTVKANTMTVTFTNPGSSVADMSL